MRRIVSLLCACALLFSGLCVSGVSPALAETVIDGDYEVVLRR